MIELLNVSKHYIIGENKTTILNDQSISLSKYPSIALTGPSGSGKSTILRMMAGLEPPTSGSIKFNNQSLYSLSDTDRSKLRRSHMGFIFQSFRLFPSLTVFENVHLACELANIKDPKSTATNWVHTVGLTKQINQYPDTLSGGEQQRVAIARALAPKPSIIFADEPTGNLDQKNSHTIQTLLNNCVKKSNAMLILITHDLDLASMCDIQLKLINHQLVYE